MLDLLYAEEWREMCSTTGVVGAMPLCFEMRQLGSGGWAVVCRMRVRDREDETTWVRLEVVEAIPEWLAPSSDFLFALARRMYDHELRERWLERGVRTRDPHAPEHERERERGT